MQQCSTNLPTYVQFYLCVVKPWPCAAALKCRRCAGAFGTKSDGTLRLRMMKSNGAALARIAVDALDNDNH